jgi:uncharacterized protein YdhG (YjbR/CyaY superfamily)
MMTTIPEYTAQFKGAPRAWLDVFIRFMKENHPSIPGKISYQIPMYKFDGTYIAFSVAKTHFTFHTLDFERIEELKGLLPKSTKFGKGSAKVKYNETAAQAILLSMCSKIIESHKER